MSNVLTREFRTLTGGLPRTFWVLWTGSLVNRLGSFVVPFLALYLTGAQGFTVEQAGFVISLHGTGTVLAGSLGGMLADRIGRRRTLAGGLWLGSLGMLFLCFARGHLWLAVAAFSLGVVGDLYRPAVSAAVADVVPPADRPRAFGLLFWVVNLGFAVSVPLAGFMSRYGYQLLFLADAATTFIYGCVIWKLVPETRPPRSPAAEASRARTSAGGSMLAPFLDPVFLAFAVLIFAVAFLFFQSQVALPMDLRQRGLSAAQYGSVLGVNGLLIVLAQPFVSRFVVRWRRSTALALAAALTGLGFGLHGVSSAVPWAVFSVIVWTLGEMTQAPVASTVVADLAPPELRGNYQGTFHMMWGLAAATAPAIGGQVLGRFGSSTLWLGCLCLGLTAAVGHLSIAGARRRRLTHLRTLRPEVSGAAD